MSERTPPGSGAVSVLSISGKGALAAVRALAQAATIPIGRPTMSRLREGGEDLDESIVCAFSEDEIELHVHGSPPLVRRVIQCLGAGPEPAPRGGTIEDLARALLADAPCEAGARILLDQAEGALSRGLRSLVGTSESERGRAIDALLERWRIAQWALRPATVVIAGRANAGKSTLFNALLGERRAIVDALPGTTRDLNRAHARLGAWPVILVDTAGDRELGASVGEQESIEVQGQARARAARASSDLVLWLEPIGAVGSLPESGSREILVRTFADRAGPLPLPPISISARDEPIAARGIVSAAFRAELDLPLDPWKPEEPVPFTRELASEIEGLRRLPTASLAPAIEQLLAAPRPEPRPGCGEERDPVACPPGIA
ncbi:MAG: GTPase [Planctomycetota bacterium]